MMRGAMIVGLLACVSACKARHLVLDASVDASTETAAPVTATTAEAPKGNPMTAQERYASYVSVWANGSRTSRVGVTSRPAASLVKVAVFAEWNATGGIGVPNAVLVDPANRHVVVCHMPRFSGGFAVADLHGRLEAATSSAVSSAAGDLLLWENGIFAGIAEMSYSLTTKSIALKDAGGGRLARSVVRFVDDRVSAVVQHPLEPHPHGGRPVVEDQVEVLINSVIRTGDDVRASLLTMEMLDATRASAAIAEDGTMVVATTGRKLIVFSSEPLQPSPSAAKRLSEKALGYMPYDVSVSNDEIALVEARGLLHPEETAYRMDDDLAHAFPSLGVHWTTRFHRLDRRGHETAQVDVPFEALMPPVLVGGGRAYIAGMGLAAVDGGKVVWSQKARTPLRATAFADGELVVTVGDELRFVARDGSVRQSFSTPEETIETPPAIGPDGAVWFATNKALYVAR